MKKILLATAVLALSATATLAEDWSGLSVGASLGYSNTLDDLTVGVHAGYRFDLGDFVLGTQAAYSTNTADVDDARVAVNGSVGVDLGNVLPYAGLGYAWDADTDEGAVFGLGVDYRIAGGNVIGLEATYDDFGANDTNVALKYSFQF
jgi:outer membrane immunogenic protein